jgi:hypothetical protein
MWFVATVATEAAIEAEAAANEPEAAASEAEAYGIFFWSYLIDLEIKLRFNCDDLKNRISDPFIYFDFCYFIIIKYHKLFKMILVFFVQSNF